jgi:hypothetical protein
MSGPPGVDVWDVAALVTAATVAAAIVWPDRPWRR